MTKSTITYRINSHDNPQPLRTIELDSATPENVAEIAKQGFTVREHLVTDTLLEELRTAVDELAEAQGGAAATGTGGNFGGLFIRNLVDKHPTFLKMLHFAPTLSLARAVLGPQIQLHAMVLRVTYPGAPNQETHWHWHQRVIPEPIPPMFSRPQVLDNLIYLDDTDEQTGGLAVLPGSHLWDHTDLPIGDTSEKPGQINLFLPAGSCVTATASLWHRGLPTLPGGRVRRLLIIGYSPTWMKQIDRPGEGLTRSLLENNPDPETSELLGRTGYY
jgi:ectoine hydroxylase-related dioxygenase (phytanoyl-CoA dioxygenase family)